MDTKRKILLGTIAFVLVIMNAFDGKLLGSTGMALLQIPFFLAMLLLIFWRKELRRKK